MIMVRRLRFECRLEADESIAGALFRSASRHVFPTIFPALREAGVPRKAIGYMQLLPSDAVASIAHVIRCDPIRLGRDAGARQGNAGPDERGRQRVAFGDFVIEGSHLEHRKRRVAPASLRISAHHRTDWLNQLLPYCPASLNLLVDTCPSCSATLGWTRPGGVEMCEHCEYDLRDASTPSIDIEISEDYRNFADLCSLSAERRQTILASLPPTLQSVPSGTLVRFALHAGQLATGMKPTPETHLIRLRPVVLAEIVAAGMRILSRWPTLFDEWKSQEAHARRDNQAAYSALKTDLLHLARRMEQEPGGNQLINAVVPDRTGSAPSTHAVLRKHYSAKEVSSRLRVDSKIIPRLRDKVDCVELSGGGSAPPRYIFEARRIDEIAADLDRCVHHWHFWKTFRVPSYGLEQLVCMDLVPAVSDPAILLLRRESLIPSDELTRFAKRLKGRRRKGALPDAAQSLRVLANAIGGRQKPWGPIYDLMLRGELPFWMRSGGVSTQHILIDPRDWPNTDGLTFDPPAFPAFPFKTEMNNSDLGELLNLQPAETRRVRDAKMLQARAYKLSLRYDVEQVVDFAGKWVSVTELIRRSGFGDRAVKKRLSAAGVSQMAGLWERAGAEAEMLGCDALPQAFCG